MKVKLVVLIILTAIIPVLLFAGGTEEPAPLPRGVEVPAPGETVYERAGNLLGYKLLTWNGEKYGRIADLVGDLGTGYVLYIVAAIPRAREAGVRLVPVPFSYLIPEKGKQSYRIGFEDLSLLENAPGYSRGTDFVDWRIERGYGYDVHAYWINALPRLPQPLGERRLRSRPNFSRYGYGPGVRIWAGALMSLSELRGHQVVDQGEAAGIIEEPVIELVSGRFASLLFRLPGNGRIYPLPASAFTLYPDTDEISLTVEGDDFEQAKSIRPGRIGAAMRKGNWDERFHDYWIDRKLVLAFRSGMRILPEIHMAATELQGFTVQSWPGVYLGRIEDAVVERNGTVPFALMVLSEGVLGTAERWHPLPTQALSLERFRLRGEVILDLEPGQVQNLPEYKRGELPDTTNPQWDETILGYWEGILSPETDLVLRRRRAARPRPSGRPQAVLLSDFLGFEIRNPLGQPLGKVRDLMIDLDQAQVEFVVLSFAETTGEEDRLYPVPFGSLELDIPFSGILMEADAPVLHQAPSFDADSWPPLLEEQNWAEQARSFWSRR